MTNFPKRISIQVKNVPYSLKSMSLIREYREDYFLKIDSRTCTVIRNIRVRTNGKNIQRKIEYQKSFGRRINSNLDSFNHRKTNLHRL